MAEIDNLLSEVGDPIFRSRLESAVAALRDRSSFGLRFERHTPELLGLEGAAIRRGVRVAHRGTPHEATFTVVSVADGEALCVSDETGEEAALALNDIIRVKRHGEPVFPALSHIDTVERGGDRSHHVLIEADNYSALQLLNWTHQRRVDCIYIDPPYNTGARDWKYNNDYVDRGDVFRSSKWLSMMERRLLLAKSLLKPDGCLIVAIDDWEASHLRNLLESPSLFWGYSIEAVVIQNNPRGGGGNNISNTHEYAFFVVPPGASLEPLAEGVDEVRDFRRRGRGERNLRAGRHKSFYAFHVDPETRQVIGVGPEVPKDGPYDTGPTPEGYLRIYPLGREGLERVWRNSRESAGQKLRNGEIELRCTVNNTIVQVISGLNKKVPIRSVWAGSRFNAGERGSNLVRDITGAEFPYPKSLYTVFDCLKAAVGAKKDAVVLDFFAGSGTTLHALELLNAVDGGRRQAILVTNNEVGERATAELTAASVRPGSDEWERQGICRQITYPRCRNAILGVGPTGESLEIEYQTGQFVTSERDAPIEALPFLTGQRLSDAKLRASLSSFLGVTRKAMAECWPFYIAPESGGRDPVPGQAILLDPTQAEAFADALAENGDHVRRVLWVPTGDRKEDKAIQALIEAASPPIQVSTEIVRAASDGLAANLTYLRLGFLDPHDVEAGACLDELNAIIWLMAGARGPRPATGASGFFVSEEGRYAVLFDEGRFRHFRDAVDRSKPDWLFMITDAREAFVEMSASLREDIPLEQRVHLYREYLENFQINRGPL